MRSIKQIHEMLLRTCTRRLFSFPDDAALEDISRTALEILYRSYQKACDETHTINAWKPQDPSRNISGRLSAAWWALQLQPFIYPSLLRGARTLTACQEITRWSESFNVNPLLENFVHGAWLKLIHYVLIGPGDTALLTSLKNQIATIFATSMPPYIENMLALTNKVLDGEDDPENQTLRDLSKILQEYLDPGEIIRILSWLVANKEIDPGRYEKMTDGTSGLPRTVLVETIRDGEKSFIILFKKKRVIDDVVREYRNYPFGTHVKIKPMLRVICAGDSIKKFVFGAEYVSNHPKSTIKQQTQFSEKMKRLKATKATLEEACPNATAGLDHIATGLPNCSHSYYFSFGLFFDLVEMLDRGRLKNFLPTYIDPIIDGILNGLQKIHKAGWVMGDIKPGNILFKIDKSEKTLRLFFSDFDTAYKLIDEKTDPEGFSRTKGYAPPRFITEDYIQLEKTFSKPEKVEAKSKEEKKKEGENLRLFVSLPESFHRNQQIRTKALKSIGITDQHVAIFEQHIKKYAEAMQQDRDVSKDGSQQRWTQSGDVYAAGMTILELLCSNKRAEEWQKKLVIKMTSLMEKDRWSIQDACSFRDAQRADETAADVPMFSV